MRKASPLFRQDFWYFDDAGRVAGRRLWGGVREWPVPVSAEHDHLPILRVPFHQHFVARIEAGWMPEKDEAMRVEIRARRGATPTRPVPVSVTHKVYFRDRVRAEKAAEALRSVGETSVRRAGDDRDWLVNLKVKPEHSAEAERGAEKVAQEFGGDYDGWETELQTPAR